MASGKIAMLSKQLVGTPPLEYLMRWRRQLARDALLRDESPVAGLAVRVGDASESAFGNAFERNFGRPPKR
jgi:AraC-like DNA-binding protein